MSVLPEKATKLSGDEIRSPDGFATSRASILSRLALKLTHYPNSHGCAEESHQPIRRRMVWFFERNRESLRLETRYDNDTAEFLLVTHSPDGREQTERFTDAMTFRQRLEALERQLEADHWTQHGPVFLHDGWKLT